MVNAVDAGLVTVVAVKVPVMVPVPATVRLLPTATLPLASLTMLLTVAEGWRMVITFAVLMAASY
jgi:hypothetical protein